MIYTIYDLICPENEMISPKNYRYCPKHYSNCPKYNVTIFSSIYDFILDLHKYDWICHKLDFFSLESISCDVCLVVGMCVIPSLWILKLCQLLVKDLIFKLCTLKDSIYFFLLGWGGSLLIFSF